MARKTETVQEYLEVKRLQDEQLRINKLRRQTTLVLVSVAYLFFVLVMFSSFRTQTFNLFGVGSAETNRLKEIENNILILQKENETLQNTLNNVNKDSISYSFLNNKISKLEVSQNALYDSVLLKPEDVVTAKLLTEKLNLQSEQLQALKGDFRRVSDLLTQIMWTVVILPILGILGFFIREKFFNKKETLF